MTGGYLRTNYSRTGNQPLTGIAGGYALTSYAGGAGLGQPYNGFIMGSVTTSGDSFVVTSNLIQISAYGAMSAWYGANLFPSGYQIIPIAFMIKTLKDAFDALI